MNLRRLFLRVLIVSLTATALFAIAVLLFAEFDDTTGKVIATTALISAFSLLGMPGGALLDQGRAVPLGWLTLALAAYALAHTLVLLWTDGDSGWRVLVSGVAYAGACSQAAATTSRRRDSDPQSVRIFYAAAIAGSFLVATLVALAAWQEIEAEGFYRVLGALAVAVLLATALQPILRRAGREARSRETFKLGLVTTGGRDVERAVEAPDFASAAASAIRELEQAGEKVVRLERR